MIWRGKQIGGIFSRPICTLLPDRSLPPHRHGSPAHQTISVVARDRGEGGSHRVVGEWATRSRRAEKGPMARTFIGFHRPERLCAL
jgi:hypothetical protein